MQSQEKVKRRIKVFFLVPAVIGVSPGQRFRFEHYLDYMEEHGIRWKLSSFYTPAGWNILFNHGYAVRKGLMVVRGFCKRFIDLFRLIGYDYVFVYREAAPLGPPVFEWIIARVLRKKIIYDFDDAIWIPVSSQYNRMAGFVKWFRKVGTICHLAHKVSVGNAFLAAYAKKYNSNTVIIPTVVNTNTVHGKLQDQSTTKPVIGWTGTFSTLKYLEIILPALQKLQEKFDFMFVVIANKDPRLPLKNYQFVPWSKETETEDLLRMHIGLMPLYDDDLSRGKCGFKAIQYMSLGIPAIVSPVGVNSAIVDDEVNGFISGDLSSWEERITQLLTDRELRQRMGEAARRKIEAKYSVISSRDQFVSLFS